MIASKITPVAHVVRKLKQADARFERGVSRGLKKAGLLVQRESQKMAPVEYGPLKASAFTRAEGKGWETKVQVGYTASYALFVHERVKMSWRGRPRLSGKGKYWDPIPRARAKFLEIAADQNKERASEIVRTEAIKAK